MIALLPAHRPVGSPLHAARAAVGAAYCAAPAVAALMTDSPLELGGLLGGVVLAGVAAGVGAELRRAAMLAVPLALLIALVNPLVSREGLTVVLDGPAVPVLGNLDFTLEALAYGAVAALRVLVVVLASALFSAAVDPDALLTLARRVAPRSALTAALATRMVPVLGRDAARMSDAYRMRADTAGARSRRLRRAAALTRALGAGALERSMETAAALEVRGYSALRVLPAAGTRDPWSRHDLAFAASAACLVGLAAAGAAAGLAGFDPYPALQMEAGAADLALAAALPAVMLAPFAAAAVARAGRARVASPGSGDARAAAVAAASPGDVRA